MRFSTFDVDSNDLMVVVFNNDDDNDDNASTVSDVGSFGAGSTPLAARNLSVVLLATAAAAAAFDGLRFGYLTKNTGTLAIRERFS